MHLQLFFLYNNDIELRRCVKGHFSLSLQSNLLAQNSEDDFEMHASDNDCLLSDSEFISDMEDFDCKSETNIDDTQSNVYRYWLIDKNHSLIQFNRISVISTSQLCV